jgi:hypothetical protein
LAETIDALKFLEPFTVKHSAATHVLVTFSSDDEHVIQRGLKTHLHSLKCLVFAFPDGSNFVKYVLFDVSHEQVVPSKFEGATEIGRDYLCLDGTSQKSVVSRLEELVGASGSEPPRSV